MNDEYEGLEASFRTSHRNTATGRLDTTYRATLPLTMVRKKDRTDFLFAGRVIVWEKIFQVQVAFLVNVKVKRNDS